MWTFGLRWQTSVLLYKINLISQSLHHLSFLIFYLKSKSLLFLASNTHLSLVKFTSNTNISLYLGLSEELSVLNDTELLKLGKDFADLNRIEEAILVYTEAIVSVNCFYV